MELKLLKTKNMLSNKDRGTSVGFTDGVKIAENEDEIYPLTGSEPKFGEWQLCPKCNGQGTVCKPPYVPGDVFQWSSSSVAFQCDVCNGAKILIKPIIP